MAKGPQIPLLVAGDTRTLLEAKTANELVTVLNRIMSMDVKWVASGNSRFEISGENAVLILSTADMPS